MSRAIRRVDLTRGEQYRLWRRRMGYDRQRAANALKVTLYWVGEVERGADLAGPPPPWYGPQELTAGERCLVYRLRSRTPQGKIAAGMGISRGYVNAMERGRADAHDLLMYWES